ncbi:MAG: metal ABC transporter permease [Candidatus Thermoplasmatota archaeon]
MIPVSLPDILSLFEYQFFQYAILGGVISSLAVSITGLFLILKREAMIGDGIAHVAFGGVALGLLLGVNPLITALIISILAVLGVSYMRRKGIARSDSAIALMLALGFSTGLIIISMTGGFNVDLLSYLFGSILTIDQNDMIIIILLSIMVISFITIFHKELLSITFDEQSAAITGIPVRPLSFIFNILVAFTITLSIKIIGVILVVALMVLPGLTALQFKYSFKGTMITTVLLAVISIVMGILLSAVYNVAASGVIVFTSASAFLLSALYRRLK